MTAAHPQAPSETAAPQHREVGIDVVRAVALIGVCVMNYHGYLNGDDAGVDTGFWSRVFNPWTGPLSTRFAATFCAVAGMGVVLLTRRAVASGDAAAISAQRWRLARRGVVLFAFGYFLDWVWPGTILFFYGALFVVGATLVTVRTRWLVAIGAGAALAAAGLQWWHLEHNLTWLLKGKSENTFSPRDLLFDVAVRGTHPLLPWLAFFCLGMVLARLLPWAMERQVLMAFGGVLLVAASYAAAGNLPWHPTLQTTHPFGRGLLYTLSATGSTVVAIVVVGALAVHFRSAAPTRWLAVAGRTSLSLYLLHVAVFNLVVDWLGWLDRGAGLGTALAFALLFWVVAVAAANAWSTVRPVGPAEWLYRRLSD